MVDSSCTRSASGQLAPEFTRHSPRHLIPGPGTLCWPPGEPHPLLEDSHQEGGNSRKAQECGLLRSGVRPRSWRCYILACSLYLTLFLRPIPVIGHFLLLNIWWFVTLPSLTLPCLLSLPAPHHLSTCADVTPPQAHLGLPVIFPSFRPSPGRIPL